ncbi:MAG TPA: S8 family serine peptidase, partial [Thermoanaerobaculia bacterium]
MPSLRPDLRLVHKVIRRASATLLLLGAAALPAAAQGGVSEPLPVLDADVPVAANPTSLNEKVQVLVELSDAPAAAVYGAVLHDKHRSVADAAIAAVAAGRAQVALIAPKQAALSAQLQRFNATEIYRVSKAMNGIAIQVEAGQVAQIRRLPGVKAVHIIEQEYPTNAVSMPFLGVPNLWGNTLGLPQGLTGTGIKIGIIDTGIDYQHANFGGTGLLADYMANPRTTIAPGLFPTAKVVGGTDFAGDAYTGANAPVPDPNPMDCNGHGSHVSGTAAGFGVTASGATFA